MQGKVVGDRYRLLSKLGQGGMGSVWRAEHVELGTAAAVKLLDRTAANSSDAQARFRREAKAAASLQSANVVQIFDYGVDHGVPYIAMELMDGESLADRLQRLERLPPEDVATILTQVARAIGKAHRSGIIHRDLKPENVFLVKTEDGEVAKVLDFGIAKTQTADASAPGVKTLSGVLIGTPYYMSPEQASGRREVDYRTDLWSMAVIAFECLTGRRPFDEQSLGGLLVAICTEPAPVPSQIAPLPPKFDAWFERGLAKDPEQRFASAQEAVAEFSYLAGRPSLVDLRPSTEPPSDAAPARTVARRLDPSTTAMLAAPSVVNVPIPAKRARAKLWPFALLATMGIASSVIVVLRFGRVPSDVQSAPSAEPTRPSATPAIQAQPADARFRVDAPSVSFSPAPSTAPSQPVSPPLASRTVLSRPVARAPVAPPLPSRQPASSARAAKLGARLETDLGL